MRVATEPRRTLRVERMTRLAEGVVEVLLVDPTGTPLPDWTPGAHLVLHLAPGLDRQYSLCGDPEDPTGWTIAVHRAPASRGGSSFVHERLRVGSTLPVDGPVNNFPLVDAPRHLLLAGGIGITPILAMARHLRATGADFHLVYCARDRSVMAYRAEIERWADARVTLHLDEEEGGPLDLAALLAEHADALIHCCGPEAMLSAVERLAPERVRLERFRAAPTPRRAEDGFEIVLARSGERLAIGPDQSIMDALERSGRPVAFSCREGICGTCETKVLQGEPDHRDSVLSPRERAENCSMMICVSRARSPELVLDL